MYGCHCTNICYLLLKRYRRMKATSQIECEFNDIENIILRTH